MPRYYDDGPSIPELIRRLERRVEALENLFRAQDGLDAVEAEFNRDQADQEATHGSNGQGQLSVVMDAESYHRLCRYAASLGQSKEQVAAEALALLLKPFDEFGRRKSSQGNR